MNTIERIRFTVLTAAIMIAGLGGCAAPKMFSLNSTWPFGDDEPKPEVPIRVAGMWTDTVLHKAGEKPQRGFGGRLMFYGKEAEKPVLVDGELVVYAFDETGREVTDNKPTRRYVFPADQISLRESDGPSGPSYSFFLPWDEAGGPQTEVSLICRFQPKGGPVVVSEQTKHLLPGSMRPPGTVTASTPPKLPEGVPSRPARPLLSSQMSQPPGAAGAQQASYQVAAAAEPNALSGAATQGAAPIQQMTTTSIALPRDFQIPHGTPPVTPSAPNVKQIVPPAQYQAVPVSASIGGNGTELDRLTASYSVHHHLSTASAACRTGRLQPALRGCPEYAARQSTIAVAATEHQCTDDRGTAIADAPGASHAAAGDAADSAANDAFSRKRPGRGVATSCGADDADSH